MVDLELIKTVDKIGKVSNFTDLTPENIKKITKAIKTVNDFNSKIESYCEHIFKSLFIDDINGWRNKLSEKDFNKVFKNINKDSSNDFVICYKKMEAYSYSGSRSGWCMGASTMVKTKYSLHEDYLYVTNTWKTKSARFDHIPWVNRQRVFKINHVNKSVEMSGDNINEQ